MWQNIETAPKDGTRVLLYRKFYSEDVAVCYWSESYEEWIPIQGSVFKDPTHWMPIPDRPIE